MPETKSKRPPRNVAFAVSNDSPQDKKRSHSVTTASKSNKTTPTPQNRGRSTANTRVNNSARQVVKAKTPTPTPAKSPRAPLGARDTNKGAVSDRVSGSQNKGTRSRANTHEKENVCNTSEPTTASVITVMNVKDAPKTASRTLQLRQITVNSPELKRSSEQPKSLFPPPQFSPPCTPVLALFPGRKLIVTRTIPRQRRKSTTAPPLTVIAQDHRSSAASPRIAYEILKVASSSSFVDLEKQLSNVFPGAKCTNSHSKLVFVGTAELETLKDKGMWTPWGSRVSHTVAIDEEARGRLRKVVRGQDEWEFDTPVKCIVLRIVDTE
ncbi:hypothetical protein BDZ91DRAFT_731491 [Kalaharituber pfeilii]|nr:hypothetical protein BDZ91DRAFT_731491 [Kalaharituber pfeilii]